MSYDARMERYVKLREEIKKEREEKKRDPIEEEKRKIRQEEEELKIERRKAREEIKKEDEEWKKYKEELKEFKKQYKKAGKKKRKELKDEKRKRYEEWKDRREKRRKMKEKRAEENKGWRKKRDDINHKKESLGIMTVITALAAVLLVIDNCTRKIYKLPLFVSGKNITAEEIAAALKELVPKELQFLISDNGRQFTAQVFKAFASQKGFIHVRITPYRPKTNGIAERGVRTIKEMLIPYSWNNHVELIPVLVKVLMEYNDRPHQGIKGFSPNEYERRVVNCIA
jgi:transposase InsO family protein